MAHALTLNHSLALPNGNSLMNRIGKAAMEESLCDANHGPSADLIALYRVWAKGGAALLLTGNVMIDRTALTGPNNVIVEDESNMAGLKAWASAGQVGGGQIWAQINHPGRQVFSMVSAEAVAPSAVTVEIKGAKGMFAVPRALTEVEIHDIIKRFTTTALVLQKAGFDGVEIHGAHGYLLSQFLSPHTNRRTDQWGGSIENRARLLLAVVRSVRQAVGDKFGIGVKLNSADFQRGGFTEDDAESVIKMLNAEQIDLLEISGGTYEAPAMMGTTEEQNKAQRDTENGSKSSTQKREAYFLTFAKKMRGHAQMPLMVTGGFRSSGGMNAALADDALDMIGMGKPFSHCPTVANDMLNGSLEQLSLKNIKLPVAALSSMAEMAWVKSQMHRIAKGKRPAPRVGPFLNLVGSQISQRKAAKRYQKWVMSA